MLSNTKWLPNPYVIAAQLSNTPDILSIVRSGGKVADAFLLDAFVSGRKQRTVTGALTVFQQIASLFDGPVSLSQAIDKSKEIWAREGYSVDEIRRVLPNLLQISDPISGDTFVDSDHLIENQVSYLDPIQGSVGDCYLISAMIALAWASTDALTARLTSADFNPPAERSFEWQFHGDAGPEANRVRVSGRIMMAGAVPRYARSSSKVEDWPSLVEKVYVAKVSGANVAQGEPTRLNYQSIDAKTEGSMPQRACQALLGGAVKGEILDSDAGRKIFLKDGRLENTSGVMSKPVMAWTKEDLGEADPDVWKKTGLWPRHAYAVLGAMVTDNRVKHVVLRNPHGADTDPDRRGYHPGAWDPDGRPTVALNKDGVFAISRKLFYDNFEDIGWISR